MESKHPEISARELSIVFCDDATIQHLNLTYRKKDAPTDVLSFSQLEGESPILPVTLGDVIISTETAQRQAQEYGVSFEQELLRLLIHGILHLFGYEHEGVPKQVAAEMRNAENKLLTVGMTTLATLPLPRYKRRSSKI